jgi:hypothetical protein
MTDASCWAGPAKPAADLAELLDREAVSRLVRTYALGFDLRDYALARSAFAPDAMLHGPEGPQPVDVVLPKLYAQLETWRSTQHLLGQQYVHILGDEALAWAYCVATHKGPPGEGRDGPTAAVLYRDRCRRYPEGWLIAERAVELMWMDPPPARAG